VQARAATDRYADTEVDYRYRLVRVYEVDAAEVVAEPAVCLLPLVPLMRRGVELTEAADRLLYESALPRGDKAEMLTALAIMAGLVSDRLPGELIARRRDLMIESVTYELIKHEGWQEGRQEGLQEGLQRGRQEGLGEGLRQGLLDAIAFGLDLRFGAAGLRLLPEITELRNVGLLREIYRDG
jgi:predicted transposase YdaD